jgi:hypothetical protein
MEDVYPIDLLPPTFTLHVNNLVRYFMHLKASSHQPLLQFQAYASIGQESKIGSNPTHWVILEWNLLGKFLIN